MIRPLRVAYWYDSIAWGGIEQALMAFLSRRQEVGISATVVLAGLANDPRLLRELAASGVPTEQLASPRGQGLANLQRVISARALFAKLKPELIHVHSIGAVTHGPVIALARLHGIPLVRTVHLPFGILAKNRRALQGRLLPPIHRRLGHLVARAIAVSEADLRALRASGLFREEACVEIPNGIPIERFAAEISKREARARLGLPEGAAVIGAVGRLAEQKRFDALIAAMPGILRARPDARLSIVGSGGLEGALRAQIQALGLGERIALHGERNDVPVCLAAFDLLAVPSLYESQGLVVPEGMAAQLPIVAAELECFREMDGGTGALRFADAGDPPALARAILEVLGDEALRAKMIQAGSRRVKRFSIGEHLLAVRALYDEVLAEVGQ